MIGCTNLVATLAVFACLANSGTTVHSSAKPTLALSPVDETTGPPAAPQSQMALVQLCAVQAEGDTATRKKFRELCASKTGKDVKSVLLAARRESGLASADIECSITARIPLNGETRLLVAADEGNSFNIDLRPFLAKDGQLALDVAVNESGRSDGGIPVNYRGRLQMTPGAIQAIDQRTPQFGHMAHDNNAITVAPIVVVAAEIVDRRLAGAPPTAEPPRAALQTMPEAAIPVQPTQMANARLYFVRFDGETEACKTFLSFFHTGLERDVEGALLKAKAATGVTNVYIDWLSDVTIPVNSNAWLFLTADEGSSFDIDVKPRLDRDGRLTVNLVRSEYNRAESRALGWGGGQGTQSTRQVLTAGLDHITRRMPDGRNVAIDTGTLYILAVDAAESHLPADMAK